MLAGLGAILLLWRLAARLTEVETADRPVVLFSFLPSSFVLSMVYADALFLVLVIACLLALLDEKWAAAGIAAAGAGFVRPSGVILVIVCAAAAGIAVVRDHDWGWLVAPVLAPLGVLSYFLYLRTPRVPSSRSCKSKTVDGTTALTLAQRTLVPSRAT